MSLTPTVVELTATVLFALALIHTFSVKRFEHQALKYRRGSVGENFFHILGEIEVVFGLWAGIFVAAMAVLLGWHDAVSYLEGLNFTEPAFVFVIMTMAATRPVIVTATKLIDGVAKLLPLPNDLSFYIVALILGPILGSFITEPAAMTVTALILRDRYYARGISAKLMYATLGILFVNVSIGGTLTHFAAPPVLMVASVWNWDMPHMFFNFGLKSAVAVAINTLAVAFFFKSELLNLKKIAIEYHPDETKKKSVPVWLIAVHLFFLFVVVFLSHHMVVFLGVFLFFLGMTLVTEEFQDELQLKEALLVGFFLGGLVVLGSQQRWWLEPVLMSLGEVPLFVGATALTAITDNAALTYLGAQVPNLSDAMKYSLVAGAVAGGGLTVIANAPNPAGFGILKDSFGPEGISPLGLLAGAIPPTLVAMACLWFLPSL